MIMNHFRLTLINTTAMFNHTGLRELFMLVVNLQLHPAHIHL